MSHPQPSSRWRRCLHAHPYVIMLFIWVLAFVERELLSAPQEQMWAFLCGVSVMAGVMTLRMRYSATAPPPASAEATEPALVSTERWWYHFVASDNAKARDIDPDVMARLWVEDDVGVCSSDVDCLCFFTDDDTLWPQQTQKVRLCRAPVGAPRARYMILGKLVSLSEHTSATPEVSAPSLEYCGWHYTLVTPAVHPDNFDTAPEVECRVWLEDDEGRCSQDVTLMLRQDESGALWTPKPRQINLLRPPEGQPGLYVEVLATQRRGTFRELR